MILVKREPIEGRGEPNLEMGKVCLKKLRITLGSEWTKDYEKEDVECARNTLKVARNECVRKEELRPGPVRDFNFYAECFPLMKATNGFKTAGVKDLF